MTQYPSSTRRASASRLLPAVLVLVNLFAIAYLVYGFERMADTVSARLSVLEQTVRLSRLEAISSHEGLGFNACLEHLQYWAPKLQETSRGTVEFFDVEERVEDTVETMALIDGAYDQIERVLTSGFAADEVTTNDEVRKWLLFAAQTADPVRGRKLLARVARADDLVLSSRLRVIAMHELLKIDKKLTGELLHEILTSESASGRPIRPGDQSRPKRGRQQQFFNFIDTYVASGHKDVEKTLTRILTKPIYYDTITLQKCVEALGTMKARNAMSIVQRLYWQPAPIPGQVPNPLFRMKCFVAVMDTMGAQAKDFMREVDVQERDTSIRRKLNEYKKLYPY